MSLLGKAVAAIMGIDLAEMLLFSLMFAVLILCGQVAWACFA